MIRLFVYFIPALVIGALVASVAQAQLRPATVKKPIDNKTYLQRPNETFKYLAAASIGEHVRRYAESKMGQQVGRGECWDLANEALGKAGAKQPGTNGYGTYVFGTPVALDKVQIGDILQFENVVFKNGGNTNNYPHHTAIVNSVKVKGKQFDLLHQNVNGNRTVQTGSINLDHMQPGGTILAYRPQRAK